MTRLVVVGGSGFLGGHVVRAAAARPDVQVTGTARNPAAHERPGDQPVRWVAADLADVGSLRAALDGADVVVHAASYVGRDAGLSEATNVRGTANLVEAASAAGVGRVVYLSTTSVYGTGPHRGVAVGDVPTHPESVASTHRLAAEELVLAAGGTALRPNLVYGAGDRWFVPALVGLTAGLGAQIDEGRALISVVSADDLGSLAVSVALSPDAPRGAALHASAPDPVSIADIHAAVGAALGIPAPPRSVSTDAARGALVPAAASEHQLALVTLDHWYDSTDAWRLAQNVPTAAFLLTDTHVAWYRSVLAQWQDARHVDQ